MTTEQKFHAAVNVIRSLPKNGSYQPSNELMLRFYAYFKQATNGPCQGSRPPFWDIVGRAKYNAWKELGDMPKEKAMAAYVEELHSIVETMSYSEKVANFLEAPTNELDTINFDDLELIAGDVLERVRSQPNSPLASREGSPIRFESKSSSLRSSPSIPVHDSDSDHSDDEYIDTIENPDPRKSLTNISTYESTPNGTVNAQNHISRSKAKSNPVDISQEISKAVQGLKTDIERLTKKVTVLENTRNTTLIRSRGIFNGLNVQTVIFIITWPFVAQFILNRFFLKRNRL